MTGNPRRIPRQKRPSGGRTVTVASWKDAVVRDGAMIYSTLEAIGERETIADLLRRNASNFPDHPVYREKRDGRFVAVTWRELLLDCAALARFLRSRGAGKGERVAVVSRNRGEMLAVEFAVMGSGAIHVPLFAGYSREQTSQLIAHSGARIVFLSDAAQMAKLAANPSIEQIVAFDAPELGEQQTLLPWFRGEVQPFGELGARARTMQPDGAEVREFFRVAEEVSPQDPCLMMYTSGTAGEMKGVVLSHDNILSQQRALKRIWGLTEADRLLGYLPWHHSFGGIFEKYNALYNAAPFALDDSLGKEIPLLLRNWKEIRPTVYFSVPAVYLELYNHVQSHPEEEDQIFHPDLRFLFTAAAPLPGHISDYLATKGIPVIEGWGLTETSPCCTVTDFHEPRTEPGMVGYPIPGVKIRLASDGEILVQGPNVMLGYHQNPEGTRAVLPGDGWFRTGDLGELLGKGLKLVARKDRIFKLLNGERVTPTPIEVRLAAMSRYIRHVVIAGSGRNQIAALIFPNTPLIESEFGRDRDRAEQEVRASLLEAIHRLNASHPVRYERIGAFAVVDQTLSVERGELTPSMKVRVANVLKNYGEYLEAIYEPSRDCDCRFLQKVMRLTPDPRRCFRDRDLTLDRCAECGFSVSGKDSGLG